MSGILHALESVYRKIVHPSGRSVSMRGVLAQELMDEIRYARRQRQDLMRDYQRIMSQHHRMTMGLHDAINKSTTPEYPTLNVEDFKSALREETEKRK
jgi:hypothetical protein